MELRNKSRGQNQQKVMPLLRQCYIIAAQASGPVVCTTNSWGGDKRFPRASSSYQASHKIIDSLAILFDLAPYSTSACNCWTCHPGVIIYRAMPVLYFHGAKGNSFFFTKLRVTRLDWQCIYLCSIKVDHHDGLELTEQ